jgi:hypothetical protein
VNEHKSQNKSEARKSVKKPTRFAPGLKQKEVPGQVAIFLAQKIAEVL